MNSSNDQEPRRKLNGTPQRRERPQKQYVTWVNKVVNVIK